ncbi:hypothetical protein H4S02_006250 [Coemansia sp. RSA 2611]|nr:hypothetical protein LPJ70_002670 [Coemansia sp. RSA 2708]KAJ2381334.1 hypothetical protein H4S02_006250 [Coemansia sp. RSA 2611]
MAAVPQKAGTACPKCATKVESFSVDTNCSFVMCANTQCTWPFDSRDMSVCFEHDAAVPSIRKRAKKRKQQISKEERRIKRRQTLAVETGAASESRKASADTLVGDIEWLTKLCDGSAQLPEGNYLAGAGAGEQPAPPESKQIESELSVGWLESMFQAAPAVDTGNLTSDSNNVAELFRALGSSDAVIPQTSRQPSPTTNSESCDDDTVAGDLALLMGTKPAAPGYLDSLSMLLSPPATASVEGTKQSDSSFLLDPRFWPAPSTDAKTGTQPAFDLNDLFAASAAPAATSSEFAPDAISPLDANSIVENLFGTSKMTPSTL